MGGFFGLPKNQPPFPRVYGRTEARGQCRFVLVHQHNHSQATNRRQFVFAFLRSELRSVDSIAVSKEKLSELADDATAASLGTLEFASVCRT
jgi:hypothetical protein